MWWNRGQRTGTARGPSAEEMAGLAHEMALACDDASLGRAQELLTGATQAWPTILYGMSLVLEEQFQRRGEPRDLAFAVRARRTVLATAEPDDETWDTCQAGLGRALHVTYRTTGDRAALDESISHCREAVAGADGDEPRLADRRNDLAVSVFSRYELTGEPAALDEAIEAARGAVRAVRPGKDPGPLVDNLARMLQDRSGPDGVTEAVVGAHRDVVAATPTEHPDWEVRLLSLQTVVLGWFTHGGAHAPVADAVGVLRRTSEVRKRGVDRPHHLSALATVLQVAHHSGGAPDALLDEAIEVGRRAVSVLPRGHARDVGTRRLLATALTTRFGIADDPADRDEARAVRDEAVARAGGSDRAEGRAVADPLDAALSRSRGGAGGNGASYDDEVDRLRGLVRNTPAGHSQRAERLCDLGLALREQFQERGDPALIDEAIEVGGAAVEGGRPGGHGRARHLSNLGAAHGDRAFARGSLADLDRGIELLDEAVGEAGRDRDLRATCLSNLGALLCQRYQRTGQASTLEQAITALRRAVNDTDPDDPRRELFLFNLHQALHPPAR